jgi:arylsulfatase A-like enzyme
MKQYVQQKLFAQIIAFSQKFNLQGSIGVALLLSFVETSLLFVAFNCKFNDGMIYFISNLNQIDNKGFLEVTEILKLFLNDFLLWYCILIALNGAFLIGKSISLRIFRQIYNLLLGTILIVFCAFFFANWCYFWMNNKQFVDIQVLIFSIQNFKNLMWYYLRFIPTRLFVFSGIAAVLSIPIWKAFHVFFRQPFKITSKKNVVWFMMIVIITSVVLNMMQSKSGQKHRPPILATVDIDETSYVAIDVIKEFSLIPKTRKFDYSGISADHPVIVLYVESLRSDVATVSPSPIPYLVSLIPQSILFKRAYAAASHTNYANLCFWYSQFSLKSQKKFIYSENSLRRGTSIFEVFKSLGYQTAYISSQNEKWGGMINWMKHPGIDYFFHSQDYEGETNLDRNDEGFFKYAQKLQLHGAIPDSETIKIAQEWIQHLRHPTSRFFLGINMQNTHYSYYLPKEHETPFKPMEEFEGMFGSWPESKLIDVRNRYFNVCYNTDKLIEKFIGFLKQEQIWDKCFFMVVGDHGEAFYEHGYPNHAGFMHEEVIQSFAMLKLPGSEKVGTIDYPISHIDLLSGVLDWLQIPQPYSFQGISPFKQKRENVYLHSNAMEMQDGIITWPWKLLVDLKRGNTELYNLENDPQEKTNMGSTEKSIAGHLMQKLELWRNAQLTYYDRSDIYSSYYPPQFP